MYKVNDMIMYGSEGVFRVEDICVPEISGAKADKLYYVLAPVYSEGKTYTPVDSRVFMRPIVTAVTARELIKSLDELNVLDIDEMNNKELKDIYSQTISVGSARELLKLVKTIRSKKAKLEATGKKLSTTDLSYLRKAEKLILSEMATALDITRDEVLEIITAKSEAI